MLTLNANGRPATFNKGAFHHLLHEISKSNHINIGDLEEQLGRAVYKSKDTIHKWHTKGPVGPDTFDSVERLAIALNLSSPAPLLHFIDGGNRSVDQLNDRQINAAKRIYDICIWFLNEFCEFIYEDLHGIYLETLNSTDLLEEQAMETPDPYEIYDQTMTRLNTIIETYV